jgi:dipeptidyl aminopeptidase/acylaminoacyl peptidase
MGIAGAPVTDWAQYDSIYTERYMRLPQNNPEGYRRSSVVAAAGNLAGRLLLVHGTIDDNVHLQNTLQLAYALQNAGKAFELMLYPRSRHGVSEQALVKHMRAAMLDFTLRTLQPAPGPAPTSASR